MLELPKMYITLHFYLYYTKDKMKCRSNLTFSGGFTWITNNVFAICGRMQIRHRLRLQNTWGTSQTMYARYERGANEMPIRYLVALCKYYQVSADYILGFTNRKIPLPSDTSRRK